MKVRVGFKRKQKGKNCQKKGIRNVQGQEQEQEQEQQEQEVRQEHERKKKKIDLSH